ncbi:hypothetical protein [Yersinia phage vB_YenM_P778]
MSSREIGVQVQVLYLPPNNDAHLWRSLESGLFSLTLY